MAHFETGINVGGIFFLSNSFDCHYIFKKSNNARLRKPFAVCTRLSSILPYREVWREVDALLPVCDAGRGVPAHPLPAGGEVEVERGQRLHHLVQSALGRLSRGADA